MSTTPGPDDATVEKCLVLGHGFHEDERATVTTILARMDSHLAGQSADQVRLDLHMKEPGQRGRKVTLECHIVGLSPLLATSADDDTKVAIAHIRDEVIRQLDDQKAKRLEH